MKKPPSNSNVVQLSNRRVKQFEGPFGCPVCRLHSGYCQLYREYWFHCDVHRTKWRDESFEPDDPPLTLAQTYWVIDFLSRYRQVEPVYIGPDWRRGRTWEWRGEPAV